MASGRVPTRPHSRAWGADSQGGAGSTGSRPPEDRTTRDPLGLELQDQGRQPTWRRMEGPGAWEGPHSGHRVHPPPSPLWPPLQPTPLVPTAKFRTLLPAHGPSGLLTTRRRAPGSGPGEHKAPTILPNHSTPFLSIPPPPVSLPQLCPLHTMKGRVPSYQEDITFPPLEDVPFPPLPWAPPGRSLTPLVSLSSQGTGPPGWSLQGSPHPCTQQRRSPHSLGPQSRLRPR